MRFIIVFYLIISLFLLIYCEQKKDKEDVFNNQSLKEAFISNDKNKISEGINILNDMIKKNPEDISLYFQKMSLLLNLKEFEEALNVINDLLILDPGNAEAYLFKGLICDGINEKINAVESYNKAIFIYDEKISNRSVTKNEMLNYQITKYLIMKLLDDKSADIYYNEILNSHINDKNNIFLNSLKGLKDITRDEIIKYFMNNEN